MAKTMSADPSCLATTRECPGPSFVETIRAVLSTGSNYLALIDRLQARYGDFFRVQIGGVEFYVLANPADIEAVLRAHRDVFVKNPLITREMRSLGPSSLAVTDGERWKTHRRLASAPFRPTALGDHAEAIGAALLAIKQRWESSPTVVRRVEHDTADFAFRVLSHMMLGESLPDQEARIREGLETEIECLTKRVSSPIRMPHWAPTPNQIRLRRAQRSLDAGVREIVARAQRPGARGFAADWLRSYAELAPDLERARSQARDQLMTIMTAGHQTASFGLAYCLHQVASHPEVAERLKDEAREVLQGRTPNPDDLEGMPFACNVVRETLRLHPVLPVVVRKTAAPFDLAGFRLPTGANVAISLWSAHRHPDQWEDPERFDPDRFTKDRSVGRHPGAYLPFSLGARNCLAGDFALFELTSAISYLSQYFTLSPDPNSTFRVVPRLALAPENGVHLRILRDADGP